MAASKVMVTALSVETPTPTFCGSSDFGTTGDRFRAGLGDRCLLAERDDEREGEGGQCDAGDGAVAAQHCAERVERGG